VLDFAATLFPVIGIIPEAMFSNRLAWLHPQNQTQFDFSNAPSDFNDCILG
jgi:hypothetical protein